MGTYSDVDHWFRNLCSIRISIGKTFYDATHRKMNKVGDHFIDVRDVEAASVKANANLSLSISRAELSERDK